MRPLLLVGLLALLPVTGACRDTVGGGAASGALDFGTVLVGAEGVLRHPLFVRADVEAASSHPAVTARVIGGAVPLVELRYAPTAPEALAASVDLVWDGEVRQVLTVVGEARFGAFEVVPAVVRPSHERSEDFWVWSELDAPLAVAEDSPVRACPDFPCVEVLRAAPDRGLPAAFRVHGAALEDTVVALSSCPDAGCRVEVGVQRRADCPAVVFEAVPVGVPSRRRVDCAGAAEVSVDHPELRIVESTTVAVTVEWTPRAVGTLEATVARGPDGLRVQGHALEARPCVSEVAPDPLVFGGVLEGGYVQRAARVRNRGPEACLWSGAEVDGRGFRVVDPAGRNPETNRWAARWLDPGEAQTVTVRFAPEAPGGYEGEVAFFLSDVGPEGRRVSVFGQGVGSHLELVTASLDFGRVERCEGVYLPIHVLNTGAAPGRILQVQVPELDGRTLTTSGGAEVPGASLASVQVLVRPFMFGTLDEQIVLTLEDSRAFARYTVPVRAELVRPEVWQEDTFAQLGRPKADLLLVVDGHGWGPAMRDSMQVNLQRFAEFTVAQQLNARAAVVHTSTASRASLTPDPVTGARVFDADDAAFAVQLARTATATPAVTSSVSALFSTAFEGAVATSTTWLRDEAVLSIIAVSLRDDSGPTGVSGWLLPLLSIKGVRNTNLFSFSAIAGRPPDGCDANGIVAASSPRLLDMANRTGGVFQSVCTSEWSRNLEDLSPVTFGLKSRFFLSRPPLQDTLEVTVNGEVVPGSGPAGEHLWTYDFPTNSINFSPLATPPPDAQIVVRYVPECGQ